MPNVTISAITFDPSGVVTIKALPSSDYGTTARRMNRIATLDGGSVTNDFGFHQFNLLLHEVFLQVELLLS